MSDTQDGHSIAYPTEGRIATIMRHTAEGIWWTRRAEEVGFKEAVQERDSGAPIAPGASRTLPNRPDGNE